MFYKLIDSDFFTFLFPFLLLMFIITGFYLAKRREQKVGKPAKSSGIESPVISFFALLISFTLASAGSAHKERLGLIHQESDGLAQLYRATYNMPDSARTVTRNFLLRHIEIQTTNNKINEKINDSMIQQIGINSEYFIAEMKRLGQLPACLPNINSIMSSTIKLIYSYDERLPQIVMLLLVISSLMIALLIGFLNRSSEERHYLASFIFLVLVTLTLQAIRDLDNPNTGSVKPSYENLNAIREMINKGE